MRILLLADSNSEHTQKWAVGLSQMGIQVAIFSLHKTKNPYLYEGTNIEILENTTARTYTADNNIWNKLAYLKVISDLKKSLKRFQPDILHAHYASSYGFLGAILGYQPYIISVWGSDVFDFPKLSFIHRKLLEYNLRSAAILTSTSEIMAKETQIYTPKSIEVVPFGVDTTQFFFRLNTPKKDNSPIRIGLIKTMSDKYGIRDLITAFYMVCQQMPSQSLELVLIGGGRQEDEYKVYANELNIADKIRFYGRVPNTQTPYYYHKIDIFVSLSVLDSESFGVSAVEAMACGCAVVVSGVGGLKEVVIANETGLVVPPNNPSAAAEAIIFLLENPEKACEMKEKARQRVLDNYDWKNNLQTMLTIYKQLLAPPK